MSYLLDANVVFPLVHEKHIHTAATISWLESQHQERSLVLCRVIQMALARLLTGRGFLKEDAMNAEEFWTVWDSLLRDPRFIVAGEPSATEMVWRSLSEQLPKGMKLDTDTYLAAFAIAGDFTLVTFDRGFLRYPGLKTEILN